MSRVDTSDVPAMAAKNGKSSRQLVGRPCNEAEFSRAIGMNEIIAARIHDVDLATRASPSRGRGRGAGRMSILAMMMPNGLPSGVNSGVATAASERARPWSLPGGWRDRSAET